MLLSFHFMLSFLFFYYTQDLFLLLYVTFLPPFTHRLYSLFHEDHNSKCCRVFYTPGTTSFPLLLRWHDSTYNMSFTAWHSHF